MKKTLYLVSIPALLLCISCKENIPVPYTNHDPTPAAASSQTASPKPSDPNTVQWTHPRSDERAEDREQLVSILKRRYEMTAPNILQAMADVPRHWFMPANVQRVAYEDGPQPIGHGQTISQPFIVAYMTQLLELTSESKVLEIGTGSGYQAAVLSELTPHVYTIEIVEPLGRHAIETFKHRAYNTIRTKNGNIRRGVKSTLDIRSSSSSSASFSPAPCVADRFREGKISSIPVKIASGTVQISNGIPKPT